MKAINQYSQDAVVIMIEAMVNRAGSQKKLAEQLGISTAYLNDVLRHRRDISAELAKKLGLRRIVSFTEVLDA